MTRTIDMVVPPTGEAIDSARLVGWIVLPGQEFRAGDVLFEIETDKSIIEIPAHEDGVMVEHLVGVDGVVNSDTLVARIQVEGESEPDRGGEEAARAAVPELPHDTDSRHMPVSSRASPGKHESVSSGLSHERKFATPAARRLADDRDIMIDAIKGSGPNERVTLADLHHVLPTTGRSNASNASIKVSVQPDKREAWASTTHGEICVNLWDASSSRSNKTVVLIHGMFGDSDTWASLAHAISRAGLRVLAMDLPCHGKTKSEVTTFAEIVESVAEVIATQCEGPVALIGHSFGAAVAARVASKPNSGVESLMLIAPVGMGTEIDQSFLNGMTHADTNEAMQRELAKLTVTGITPSVTYVNELRQCTQARRDRLVELCRQVSWNGVQQLNAVLDLTDSQCFCVVIHGRRDAIIPWQQVLNLPPRVALHLLPDAGHMPQWEAGRLITDIVLDAVGR